MVIVASIYLRYYIEVGVGTFLPTPTPPKIPSESDATALVLTVYSSVVTTPVYNDTKYSVTFMTL
jgi:hypothetical protein